MRREFSPAVRQAALARAYHRCERCESKSQLELHHRGHAGDRSGFNCEVLCVRCHRDEHHHRCAARSGGGRGRK
jgi:hypothetical protein